MMRFFIYSRWELFVRPVVCKPFLPACHFAFLTGSLPELRAFISKKSNLWILAFDLSPSPPSWRFSPIFFSSNDFIGVCFTYETVVHFYLIFVQNMRLRLFGLVCFGLFFFCQWICNQKTICLKDCPSSIGLLFHVYQKSVAQYSLWHHVHKNRSDTEKMTIGHV